MDDKYKKLLQEEKERVDLLKNEPHFEVSSFVEEILPLLADYFVGEFAFKENAIICSFANGQTVRLAATEVCDDDGDNDEDDNYQG